VKLSASVVHFVSQIKLFGPCETPTTPAWRNWWWGFHSWIWELGKSGDSAPWNALHIWRQWACPRVRGRFDWQLPHLFN